MEQSLRMRAAPEPGAGYVLWAAHLPDVSCGTDEMCVAAHPVLGWLGSEPLIADESGVRRPACDVLAPRSVRVLCSAQTDIPTMAQLYAQIRQQA